MNLKPENLKLIERTNMNLIFLEVNLIEIEIEFYIQNHLGG